MIQGRIWFFVFCSFVVVSCGTSHGAQSGEAAVSAEIVTYAEPMPAKDWDEDVIDGRHRVRSRDRKAFIVGGMVNNGLNPSPELFLDGFTDGRAMGKSKPVPADVVSRMNADAGSIVDFPDADDKAFSLTDIAIKKGSNMYVLVIRFPTGKMNYRNALLKHAYSLKFN